MPFPSRMLAPSLNPTAQQTGDWPPVEYDYCPTDMFQFVAVPDHLRINPCWDTVFADAISGVVGAAHWEDGGLAPPALLPGEDVYSF